uniref:Uncharacterized protein n=1 Tax=Cannabis sativa TaxID=3483 RepID=A0A803QSM0_CANSA
CGFEFGRNSGPGVCVCVRPPISAQGFWSSPASSPECSPSLVLVRSLHASRSKDLSYLVLVRVQVHILSLSMSKSVRDQSRDLGQSPGLASL